MTCFARPSAAWTGPSSRCVGACHASAGWWLFVAGQSEHSPSDLIIAMAIVMAIIFIVYGDHLHSYGNHLEPQAATNQTRGHATEELVLLQPDPHTHLWPLATPCSPRCPRSPMQPDALVAPCSPMHPNALVAPCSPMQPDALVAPPHSLAGRACVPLSPAAPCWPRQDGAPVLQVPGGGQA